MIYIYVFCTGYFFLDGNQTVFPLHICHQVVALEMKHGDQVYLELMSGRKLCTHLQHNIFTGYIVYPHIDE